MFSGVHDLIIDNKFHQNWSSGFRTTGVRKLGSPIDLACRPYNIQHYHADCDLENDLAANVANRSLIQPGIERVQALADISRSAVLFCYSNETHAPIANPPNSAELEGTCYHSRNLHPGPYSMWENGDGQAHRHTELQTTVTNIHFASATPHAKCNH